MFQLYSGTCSQFSEVQEFTHGFETMTIPCQPPFRNRLVHITVKANFRLWKQQVVGQSPSEGKRQAALDPKSWHMWLTFECFNHEGLAMLMSKPSSVMWSLISLLSCLCDDFFFLVCTSLCAKRADLSVCLHVPAPGHFLLRHSDKAFLHKHLHGSF